MILHVARQVRLGQYRVRVDDVEVDCPACGGFRKFSISAESGAYGCFTCSTHGRVGKATTQHRGAWAVIRRAITATSGAAVEGRPGGGVVAARGGVSPRLWEISAGLGPVGHDGRSPAPSPALRERALAYALRRGVHPRDVGDYRLCVAPMSNRIWLPYWEEGELVYWTGRAMGEEQPKTVDPGAGAEKPLFGLHVRRPEPGSVIPLVEGGFDHFATPTSLALMGKTISRHQLETLVSLEPSWVPIILDPGEVAAAAALCRRLWRHGIRSAWIEMPGSQDPGDLGRRVMQSLIEALQGMPAPTRARGLRPTGLV